MTENINVTTVITENDSTIKNLGDVYVSITSLRGVVMKLIKKYQKMA